MAEISGTEWVAIIAAIAAAVQVIGTVVNTVMQNRTQTEVINAGAIAQVSAASAAKKAEQVAMVVQDATVISEQMLTDIAKVGTDTLKASVDTLAIAEKTEHAVNGQCAALCKLAYEAGVRDERERQAREAKGPA